MRGQCRCGRDTQTRRADSTRRLDAPRQEERTNKPCSDGPLVVRYPLLHPQVRGCTVLVSVPFPVRRCGRAAWAKAWAGVKSSQVQSSPVKSSASAGLEGSALVVCGRQKTQVIDPLSTGNGESTLRGPPSLPNRQPSHASLQSGQLLPTPALRIRGQRPPCTMPSSRRAVHRSEPGTLGPPARARAPPDSELRRRPLCRPSMPQRSGVHGTNARAHCALSCPVRKWPCPPLMSIPEAGGRRERTCPPPPAERRAARALGGGVFSGARARGVCHKWRRRP